MRTIFYESMFEGSQFVYDAQASVARTDGSESESEQFSRSCKRTSINKQLDYEN